MVVNTLYGTAKNLMKHSCKMHMLIAHVHCEINLRKKNKIKSLAYFHIDRILFYSVPFNSFIYRVFARTYSASSRAP